MAQSVRHSFDQRPHIAAMTFDATWKESPLWARMIKDGGVKVRVGADKFHYDYATVLPRVQTIAKGQQLDTSRAEQNPGYQRATYIQSGYWVNDIFDGIELSQSTGPQKVRPMKETAIKRLKRQLDTIMKEETMIGDQTNSGNNIVIGGGGLRFKGVLQVLNDTPTSGTLYGVQRAANPMMQHTVLAGTDGVNGNPVTDIWDLLNHAMTQTAWDWEGGHKEVDLILFGRANERIFHNRLQAQKTDVATGDPGRKTKVYDGKEWGRDDFLPAGVVLGLNTSTWCFWTPRGEIMAKRFIDGHPNYPIGTEVYDYEIHGSLLNKAPRNNFKLTGISL